MNEQELEKEIQAKGLNAPRLTPEMIDDKIADTEFVRFAGSTVIVCKLRLTNGFEVIGTSACVSPENFDEQIGHKIARDKARDKIWELEGYLLKEHLLFTPEQIQGYES